MPRSKKSRLERQSSRFTPIGVKHDDRGNYINYCTFGCHPGIVGDKILQERQCVGCNHYRRYREEKNEN